MTEQISQDSNAYTGGSAPAAPAAAAPAAAPARPKWIDIAFWALIASAALLLIRIAVGIAVLNTSEYQSALEDEWGRYLNMPGWLASHSTSYVTSGIGSGVITVLLAFFIRKGYNWARIVLIVVTVLWALNARVQFMESVPVYAAAWITLVSVLLTIAAIVLSFLPPSGTYFKSMKQYRKGKKLSPMTVTESQFSAQAARPATTPGPEQAS